MKCFIRRITYLSAPVGAPAPIEWEPFKMSIASLISSLVFSIKSWFWKYLCKEQLRYFCISTQLVKRLINEIVWAGVWEWRKVNKCIVMTKIKWSTHYKWTSVFIWRQPRRKRDAFSEARGRNVGGAPRANCVCIHMPCNGCGRDLWRLPSLTLRAFQHLFRLKCLRKYGVVVFLEAMSVRLLCAAAWMGAFSATSCSYSRLDSSSSAWV